MDFQGEGRAVGSVRPWWGISQLGKREVVNTKREDREN